MATASTLSYGTVVGQYLVSASDSADVDALPDAVPASGTVTFTPSVGVVLDHSTSPNPSAILRKPIVASLDASGYLIAADGTRGVKLIATDNLNITPKDWTWVATYALTDAEGNPLRTLVTQPFLVPAGVTTDLIEAMPLSESNGVIITRGVKGDTGPTGPTGATGPQGIQGIQGMQGIQGVKGDTGDPSAYELRGTGNPNGVVTASPGTYYTDTAGTNGAWRWLKSSGTGNTGWTILLGDTGRRNISSLFTGASGATATIRRIGDVVYLTGRGILTVSGYGALLATLPDGFRTGLAVSDNDYFWWQDYTTFKTAYIDPDGTFRLANSPTLNAAVSVRINFPTTQPWPSVLPGTLA